MQTHMKHCGVKYLCACEQSFNERRKLMQHIKEAGGGAAHREVEPPALAAAEPA